MSDMIVTSCKALGSQQMTLLMNLRLTEPNTIYKTEEKEAEPELGADFMMQFPLVDCAIATSTEHSIWEDFIMAEKTLPDETFF